MSDIKLFTLIGIAVFVFIAALASGTSCVEERSDREACRQFCEDFGETAYHSTTYGCFCVTSDGQRYNPDTLTKAAGGAP